MPSDLLPRAAQQILPLGAERHIPKAGQLSGVKTPAGKEPHHGPLSDGLCQVHEASAFCNARQSSRQFRRHRIPHRMVLTQLPRMQFRISASQIKAVNPRGQRGVRQRTKRHQLCAHGPQHLQIFRIVEGEGRILCHRNPHRLLLRQRDRFAGKRRRGTGQLQQSVQIDAVSCLMGQAHQFFLQSFHFRGCYQSQMAALQPALRHDRQIAQRTDLPVESLLNGCLQHPVGSGGAAI